MKRILFMCSLVFFYYTSVEQASSIRRFDYLPKGFVYLGSVDSSIEQNLAFATSDNLVGVPLDGYESKRAICTYETALALAKVQKELKSLGFCLRIDDAYRPSQAVKHLKRWAKDLKDQKTKSKYYPNIDKKDLVGKFVAVNRSPHSRGSTVDVTILNDKTKEELDFGPQTLGAESAVYDSSLTPEQQKNRLFLREVMLRYNFKPYNKE